MNVILISREFGSGGRELAKGLAKELGYKYIDSAIISKIAKEAELSEEYVKEMIDNPTIDASTVSTFLINPMYENYTKIIMAQRKVLNEITSKHNCVIVGRGATLVDNNANTYSIFVHASIESKLKRCMEHETDKDVKPKQIIKQMKRIDKNRRRFQEMYYDITWGDKSNYDMMLNTSNIEIKDVIKPLSEFIKAHFEAKNPD